MNKIRIIILLFLCTITFEQSFAQNNIITGKIVDAETHKPIDLVSVYCSPANTITNEDGEFELKSIVGDSVIFSHIIYETKKINAKKIPAIIELKPKTLQIAEVVVTPNKIIAELKEVREKYIKLSKENKAKSTSFYYFQAAQVDTAYSEMTECFFTALTNYSVGNLTLQKGRFAEIEEINNYSITNFFSFSKITPIQYNDIKKNEKIFISFLCPTFYDFYDITLSNVINNGKNNINVYKFVPKPDKLKDFLLLYGNLYIDEQNKAIVRLEAEMTDKKLFSSHSKISYAKLNNIITYNNNLNPYPIVETVQCTATINLKNGHTKTTTSKLYAVDYNFTDNQKQLSFKDELSKAIEDSKYDASFWSNPPIKRTEKEQQIVDKFNDLGYFGNFELNK